MDGVGLGVTGVLVGMGSGVFVGPDRVTMVVGLAVGVSRIGDWVQVGSGVQVGGCIRVSPATSSTPFLAAISIPSRVGTRVASWPLAGWQPAKANNDKASKKPPKILLEKR